MDGRTRNNPYMSEPIKALCCLFCVIIMVESQNDAHTTVDVAEIYLFYYNNGVVYIE